MNHPHLAALHQALFAEEAFVRAEFTKARSAPIEEQVALGMAWAGVRYDITEVGRRRLEVIVRGELHEGIQPGAPVEVAGIPGRCVGWDPKWAELILEADGATRDAVPNSAPVQLALDTRGFVRLRQGLEQADALETPLKTALLEGPEVHEAREAGVWAGLNGPQAVAADQALAAPHLGLIHGPPGTGKTRTLVAILDALVARGDRCLAMAESNAAVDHLACSAAKQGLKVVRVGPTFRVSSEATPLTLAARILAGPHADALKKIAKEIGRARKAGGPQLWRLMDEQRRLRDAARHHVLQSAEVLAITFGSLHHWADSLPPTRVAVVDEVTQALEPSVWMAVPLVKKLILAGDPHQLGPVVKQPKNLLSHSLLHRFDAQGVTLPMLTIQHRMNREIQSLVNGVYGPEYQPAEGVADRVLEAWPFPPVLFIDTVGSGPEERDPLTQSTFNALEVELVGVVLKQLRQIGVCSDRIGVIAPYSAQVRRLAALPEAEGVEVATVNAFQGREADVIIVSFTRSNSRGLLGFVSDRRRLTVATTRARLVIVLVGDSGTLGKDQSFDKMMCALPVSSVWEAPWSDAWAR